MAILLVFLQHFQPYIVDLAPPMMRSGVAAVCDSGWVGVDMFFVLSGFLITAILLRTRTSGDFWKSFYIKRLFRIGPVFLMFCLPVALAMAWAGTVPRMQAFLLMTPLANWAMMPNGVPYLPHLWSLAVEEQFYLFWPFVVRACRVEKVRNIALWISVGSVAAHFAGARLRLPVGILYRSTITHVVGISLGAALATVDLKQQPAKLAYMARLAIATGICLLLIDLAVARLFYHYPGIQYGSPYLGEVAMVGTSVFTAGCVLLAVLFKLPGWAEALFSSAWLRWFGSRSYALYIVHFILIDAYVRKPTAFFNHGAYRALIASLLISELSWRFVEAPCSRMARRLTHQREPLLTQQQPKQPHG